MDILTLIYVLAAIVTIAAGAIGLARYLQTRWSKETIPNNPGWNRRHIADLILTHRVEQAIKECEKAIRKNPRNYSAYVHLSWALNEVGRYQEALDASNRAINLKEDAGAYSNRGWALQSLKRYSEALEAFDKAILIDSNFVPAYRGKGDVLSIFGHDDQALAAYDRAITLNPGFIPSYKGKAKLLERQGKFKEAQELYKQAQRLE